MKSIATLHVFVAICGIAIADLPAITEEEYRSKYPFAVNLSPGDIKDHPGGRYRVFTQFGVRECDLEEGDVEVLAFYDGDKLIRSYSLKQLFPERESWDFHPASGVFLWLIFSPKLNGFHGQTYTIVTESETRTFSIETGAPIKNRAEQAVSGNAEPPAR